MKTRLLLLLTSFLGLIGYSQNILLENAIGLEGTNNIYAYGVKVDSDNNKFVGGTFKGTADFDPSNNVASLTTNGGYDIFIAKYDEQGNYLWAFNLGGTTTSGFFPDVFGDMIIDNEGNLLITGEITMDVDMDPTSNTALMDGGMFLAKYTSDGQYLWAFSIYGSSLSQGVRELAVDSSNNVYMGGVFANNNGDFDPSDTNDVFLEAVGSNDYFIAKYDALGNYLNAFNLGSVSSDTGAIRLFTDSAQNLYVTSTFSDVMDFDTSNQEFSLDPEDDFNIFLAKYTSVGNFVWAKNIDTIDDTNNGSISNGAYGFGIDADDNIYISGVMGLPIDFDPSENNAIINVPNYTKKSFVAKYNNDGLYLWAIGFANTANSVASSIVIDDDSNNIFVTGYSNSSADFDPSSAEDIKTNQSSYNSVYIASFNKDGVYKWAKLLEDDLNTRSSANEITFNKDKSEIVIAGFYSRGDIDLDPSAQENTLTTSHNYNYSFIASYSFINTAINANGLWSSPTTWSNGVVPTANENVIIPAGTTIQISDEISEIHSLQNEGNIVINPTFSLKSKTNMVNTGSIVMNSGTDDSSVLFIEGTATGEVKYTRGGLKANQWSLVTPPVSGQKIKEFATEIDNDIRINTTVTPNRYAIGSYVDSASDGEKWSYFTENVDPLATFTAGESYAISRNTDGAVSFTGTLTTNNLTRTLQPGEWNAIGNPFTTYYPANKNGSSSFLNDNYDILDDDYKGIYVWDNTQNKYVIVSELDIQNRAFTPGQGFFIKLKEGENEVAFNEAKRSLKPTTGDNGFSKSTDSYIELFVDNGTNKVKTDIKFLNNATTGFDVGMDIGNFNSSTFDLFTHLVDNSNSKNYTIQSLPISTKETVVIPLGILSEDTEVVFSTKHKNLLDNTVLLIEDRANNTFIDITNKESNYKIETSEKLENRFYLHISNVVALDVQDAAVNSIQVSVQGRKVHVQGLKQDSFLEIFNLLGQEVFNDTFKHNGEGVLLPTSIKSGVYLLKLSSKNGINTKKVIIH